MTELQSYMLLCASSGSDVQPKLHQGCVCPSHTSLNQNQMEKGDEFRITK